MDAFLKYREQRDIFNLRGFFLLKNVSFWVSTYSWLVTVQNQRCCINKKLSFNYFWHFPSRALGKNEYFIVWILFIERNTNYENIGRVYSFPHNTLRKRAKWDIPWQINNENQCFLLHTCKNTYVLQPCSTIRMTIFTWKVVSLMKNHANRLFSFKKVVFLADLYTFYK